MCVSAGAGLRASWTGVGRMARRPRTYAFHPTVMPYTSSSTYPLYCTYIRVRYRWQYNEGVQGMARETITRLLDDVDGGDADETVTFGLDSRIYSIDLSEKNATMLREALAPYVEVATPDGNVRSAQAQTVPSRRRQRSGDRVERVQSDAGAIRAWAQEHGRPISDRGRISAGMRAEYEAATR